MTMPRRKTVRRRIVSTLVWTLGLLLLTNVFWSVIAASPWGDPRRSNADYDFRQGVSNTTESCQLLVNHTSAAIQDHYEVVLIDPNYFEPFFIHEAIGMPFDDVVANWVNIRVNRELAVESTGMDVSWFRSVGWPVRLLWEGYVPHGGDTQPIPFTSVMIAEPDDWGDFPSVLPIRPIWTGQLFYATCWLGIVLAAPFTRRRFRTWRSRCINCNYDLRANTTGMCPECGSEDSQGEPI